jgi:hypothetical protein
VSPTGAIVDKATRRDGTTTLQQGTMSRFVVATLLVALGMPLPATAVDLSGDYVVSDPIPCRLTDVQTGSALQVSGSCSNNSTTYTLSLAGTVDPGTGAFSVTGEYRWTLRRPGLQRHGRRRGDAKQPTAAAHERPVHLGFPGGEDARLRHRRPNAGAE